MTSKIMDATILSASLDEITSIDLIEICSSQYQITTTSDVEQEILNGFPLELTEKLFSNVIIKSIHDARYDTCLNWLERRYPYLHRGELSTLLLSLIEYELKNAEYYYVTDDGRMRKSIPMILLDNQFLAYLEVESATLQLTGTIGLIKRLYERGLISNEKLMTVIEDLQRSTFRVSPNILSTLRGLLNENEDKN